MLLDEILNKSFGKYFLWWNFHGFWSLYVRFTVHLLKYMFLDILIIFSESAVGPLIQKLTQLWTQFQTSISSDLSDYLSVEHLAIILQKISEKGKICSCKFVIFSVAVCLCNMIQSLVVCFHCLSHFIMEIVWRICLYI